MMYLFIVICVCVYALMPDCLVLGVSTESLNNAFIYQIAHGSWQHLFINSLSLIMMFKPIHTIYEERFGETSQCTFICFSYIGSVLAALLSARHIPTVGASGIVFFLLGMLIMLRPTLKQLQGYIFVLIAIIVQIIQGKSNVALHIIAFILGALFIITQLLCKQYKERLDGCTDN